MTFHFPHMAPPGADARRDTPVASWPRDAQLRALLTRHAELRAG